LSTTVACTGIISPAGTIISETGTGGSGSGSGGDDPGGDSTGGTGGDGDPSGGGTGSTTGPGTRGTGAVTGMRSTPGDLPLPRLSHDEYIQTVRDLVTQVMPKDASAILSSVISLTDDLPADQLVTISTEKHGGFARDDQSEQQEYTGVPFDVGHALAAAMTQTPARIAALMGSCAGTGASVTTACLQSFVRTFGEVALRHPLSDADVTFYAATATSNPVTAADLVAVLTVMLSSPRFLYRVESGADLVTGTTNQYKLDAWELASRLSYHLWGTMPDAGLRAAAKSGALLTNDGYASEIKRLLADPRSDTTVHAFFEQWLWPLLELPAMDSRVNDTVFRAFAGANLPTASLRDHMVGDVLDAASWVMRHDGSLGDLLTNQQSFARDADLASIYGVAAWDGQGTPPMLPAPRSGLLTRAAFLATGTINTRPIMKGVFIREGLLCDALPAPPANAASAAIVVKENQTTRQVIQALTEAPGTVCASCHKSIINPLGFATENFDSLGRGRTAQAFFDSTGKMTTTTPVDTTSIPNVVVGDLAMSAGAGDMTQLIVASGKVQKCFARKFFRFAFRRIEDDKNGADAAAIASMADLAQSGRLADVFTAVVSRPEFTQRLIQVTP